MSIFSMSGGTSFSIFRVECLPDIRHQPEISRHVKFNYFVQKVMKKAASASPGWHLLQEHINQYKQRSVDRNITVSCGEPCQKEHDQIHADKIHVGSDIRDQVILRDNDQHIADHGRNQGRDQRRDAFFRSVSWIFAQRKYTHSNTVSIMISDANAFLIPAPEKQKYGTALFRGSISCCLYLYSYWIIHSLCLFGNNPFQRGKKGIQTFGLVVY